MILILCFHIAVGYREFLQLRMQDGVFSDELQADMDRLENELIELETETGLSGTEVIIFYEGMKTEDLNRVNRAIEEFDNDNSNCGEHNECSGCIDDGKCVWCNVDNKCYLGDENGATMESCYSFQNHYCYLQCEEYNNLDECLLNETCMWCNNASHCSSKNSNEDCEDVIMGSSDPNGQAAPIAEAEEEETPSLDELYAAEDQLVLDLYLLNEVYELTQTGKNEEEEIIVAEASWVNNTRADIES